MEKNYYQILEVDKNASEEIIDRAYKTLAKKYHPDLQKENKKEEYEEKMKQINEAYSILSDEMKKSAYDVQLQESTIPFEEYQKILKENIILKEEIERLTVNLTNNNVRQQYTNTYNMQNPYYAQESRAQQTYKRTYQQPTYRPKYAQNINNTRGRHTTTVRYCIKVVSALICIMLFIMLILNIPFVKTYFSNLYQDNIFLKAIVDTFVNTFKQLS